MAMITIEFDSRPVLDALNELRRRGSNISPALHAIGNDLVESTQRRFGTSTAPDGTPWAANSEVTLLRYLGLYASSYKKDGSLSKKGAARAGAKKPLIGESKSLSTTIGYRVVDGGQTLLVGSPQKYAAVQQFGASAREFGKAPWGDIPARPFLGVSAEDERNILDVLRGYFAEAI